MITEKAVLGLSRDLPSRSAAVHTSVGAENFVGAFLGCC